MHAVAHRGFITTISLGESAFRVDVGRKIPCCPGESNLHQISIVPGFSTVPNEPRSISGCRISCVIFLWSKLACLA